MNSKIDWWDTISDAEKNSIDEGLEDVKNGNVLTHEQVMEVFKRNFGRMMQNKINLYNWIINCKFVKF